MSKDKRSVATSVRHSQQRDHDDDHAAPRPVYTDLVDQVKVFGTKDIDTHANQHDGPEHQDGLVLVRHKVFFPERDGRQDQLPPREIDTQSDRPIADKCEPASNPASHGRVLARAEHGRPVVDAARGGIDGTDFCKRCGDAERDERDENPTPENGHCLAIGERNVHCCREAERDGHNGERPVCVSASPLPLIEEARPEWSRRTFPVR